MAEDIRRKGVVDSLKFEVNIAAKVITGEVEIEAPPEKLWTMLTPTDEIVTWYDEGDSITPQSSGDVAGWIDVPAHRWRKIHLVSGDAYGVPSAAAPRRLAAR